VHIWAAANRFIEHHEEEAIQRLREEQFQVAERLAQVLLSLAPAIRFQRQGCEVSQRSGKVLFVYLPVTRLSCSRENQHPNRLSFSSNRDCQNRPDAAPR